jgi:hypothetical protein
VPEYFFRIQEETRALKKIGVVGEALDSRGRGERLGEGFKGKGFFFFLLVGLWGEGEGGKLVGGLIDLSSGGGGCCCTRCNF